MHNVQLRNYRDNTFYHDSLGLAIQYHDSRLPDGSSTKYYLQVPNTAVKCIHKYYKYQY